MMARNNLLAIAAASEVATGVILFAHPAIVVRLLFNAEITGATAVISRMAGISLIALGASCWPANGKLRGMLTYSLLATLYLFYLAAATEWNGIVLWPAIVIHAGITILLAREWLQE